MNGATGFWRTRGSLALSLVVLVTVVLLISAAPAWAGTVGNWSAQPKGNTTTGVPIVAQASGAPDGYPLVASSIKLTIDGVLIPRASYTATISSAKVYLYYNPSPVLRDGLRTFRVEVKDTLNRLSFYEWSATVRQPPSGVWISPSAGQTIYSGSPQIVMSLADNTPGTTFSVAGQVRSGSSNGTVVSTFGGTGLAAGSNTFTLPDELVFGTYTLTATITDGSGNARTLTGTSARSFTTVTLPAMTVLESCDACHADMKSAHPTPASSDCGVCHPDKVDDHMQGTEYCEDCHWEGWHTGGAGLTVAVTGPCFDCHNHNRTDIARHTAHSAAAAHESSCNGCHYTSVIAKHGVTPVGSVYAYQCDVCHGSTQAEVVAAIDAENTKCSGCHPVDHESRHATTVPASCQGSTCHSGTSLTTIHINSETELTCESCHESADEDVVGAIDGHDTSCAACHDASGHTAQHEANVSPGPVTFFDGSSSHANSESGAIDVSADCTLCHASTNLIDIHGSDCSVCHSGAAPPRDSFGTWNGTCSQGSCHPTYHDNASPGHDEEYYYGCSCHDNNGFPWNSEPMSASEDYCAGCHATGADTTAPTTVSDALSSYVGPASVVLTATDDRAVKATYYRLDGEVAQVLEGEAVYVASPASGTEVHTLEFWSTDWSANAETPHTTASFAVSADTQAPVTTSNAQPSYNGPATIELSATDNATSLGVLATYYRFDEGATQTGTTAQLPQPSAGVESHTVYFWSVDHAGNIEDESSAEFTVTADNVAPTTTSDLLPDPMWYRGGRITITLNPSDPSPSSGIVGIHVDSSNTSAMWLDYHEAGWNGSAGAWQLGMWAFASGDYPVTWYARDNAGNIEAPPQTTTIRVDGQAPVTTCNAQYGHTYAGAQTFTLTTTDAGGSGVDETSYRVDSGPWTSGTSVPVPAPASGTVSRTISWLSKDTAGNQTSGSTSVYIQAAADTIAPTGSLQINAGSAWTKTTAVTLAPSASDNLGVTQMQFSNDNVAWSSWETYSAVAKSWTLASGNGSKTVYARYRDASGNVSAVVNDSIGLDSTAPSTTSNVVVGQAYEGAQTFTLTPTDTGGSGLVGTWWQLDSTSGSWTSGTSMVVTAPSSGTLAHTLYWYSTDGATNAEVIKSVAFSVSAPGVDTLAPAGSLVINGGSPWTNSAAVTLQPSATDNVGVYQMRFSNDGVTWSSWEAYSSAAKNWTLAAGEGAKTVYAQYSDLAGNLSAVENDTIGLDTLAPATTHAISAPPAGSGSVTLSATDAGSGPQTTKYILTVGGVAGAEQTHGSGIPLPAPGSGTTVYSVEYWSIDAATNAESPHKYTGNIAINAVTGLTTLNMTLTNGSLHAWMQFTVEDVNGVVIADSGELPDEHTGSYSVQVPAGHEYTMRAYWWIADYDGGGEGSDAYTVTPAQTTPGATIPWVVYY